MTEVIVALDVDALKKEQELIERLHGTVTFFKVGLQLFTAHGKKAVEVVQKRGGRVFLDLKLHDIPQTVALAVCEAQKLGVSLSLHLSGASMLRAAAEISARQGLWGVTMLTSLTSADAKVFMTARSAPSSKTKRRRRRAEHRIQELLSLCRAIYLTSLPAGSFASGAETPRCQSSVN